MPEASIKALIINEKFYGPKSTYTKVIYIELLKLYKKLNHVQNPVEYLVNVYSAKVKQYPALVEEEIFTIYTCFNDNLDEALQAIHSYDEEAYAITIDWLLEHATISYE